MKSKLFGLAPALLLAPALALSAAFVAPAFVAPASAQSDDVDPNQNGLLIDPPLYVTNQSGAPVELAWQTSIPGAALSPPRNATIADGAEGQRVEPGLYWIVMAEGEGELLADNVVYLSTSNGAGGYAEQIAVQADFFGSLSDVKKAALAVTIAADGTLSAAPRLDE